MKAPEFRYRDIVIGRKYKTFNGLTVQAIAKNCIYGKILVKVECNGFTTLVSPLELRKI